MYYIALCGLILLIVFDRLARSSISCCVTAALGCTGHISSGKSTPKANQVKGLISFLWVDTLTLSQYLNFNYNQTTF